MQNVLSRGRSESQSLRQSLCGLSVLRSYHEASRITPITLPGQKVEQDEHRTYKVRRNGRTLPLPPRLDPVILSKRLKYSKLDAQAWNAPTPTSGFRQELAANPYAAALATPIRQCDISMVRMPRHLLQRFGVVRPTEDSRRMRVEPCLETSDQPGMLKKVSAHIVIDADVFDDVSQRHNWDRLLAHRLGKSANVVAGRSPHTAIHYKSWDWDSDTMSTVEAGLRKKALDELQSLAKAHSDLLLSEEEALGQLDKVAAFVKVHDGPASVNALHGKSLFVLASEQVEGPGADPIAITYHELTIPLMLALERTRHLRNNG